HLLNRIVRVPERVPLGHLRLRPPGEVRGPGTQRHLARLVDTSLQLPPLPAVPIPLGDEAGRLPRAAIEAHLDPSNRRGTRPRNAAHNQLATLDLVAGLGLGDKRANALQRERLFSAVLALDTV